MTTSPPATDCSQKTENTVGAARSLRHVCLSLTARGLNPFWINRPWIFKIGGVCGRNPDGSGLTRKANPMVSKKCAENESCMAAACADPQSGPHVAGRLFEGNLPDGGHDQITQAYR
jgi:hypothetical protein